MLLLTRDPPLQYRCWVTYNFTGRCGHRPLQTTSKSHTLHHIFKDTSIKITKLQFTTCANKERVLKYTLLGGVAQLVERSVRIRKVKSSTLSVSTTEACCLDRLLFFCILKLIGESNSIVHVRRFAVGGGARTYNRIFAKQMKKACLFRLSPSPP